MLEMCSFEPNNESICHDDQHGDRNYEGERGFIYIKILSVNFSSYHSH